MGGTKLVDLQAYLKNTGRYDGKLDGLWGPRTEGAILMALEDGPDTALTEEDFCESAARLQCPVENIKAVTKVEAAGAGFFNGRPKILTEPHIFSRLTKGRFDDSHPHLSYPRWGTRPYPRTQEERYDLLLKMVRLDIDAGFSAASYGKFQIMGMNHRMCGFPTSWQFAFAQAVDEETQLMAFEAFIISAGLLVPLQLGQWAKFAKGYNGPAYVKNRYDVKLAQAAREFAL